MANAIDNTLADVLGSLEEITKSQMQPTQALAHFHNVRMRHLDSSLELVWEDQSFDGSVHYDALIRPAGANQTISVSVCPDDALPWALRGLHRWRDSELLRVNGITMAVEQAISQLDVLWEKAPLMQRLVDSCIIEGELQRRHVEVSASDIQAAFDSMRRRRGLFTVAALQAWIRNSGVTMAALQDLATKRARAAKLRQLVVGDRAESHFAAHSHDFDEIKLALFQARSAEAAQRIAREICDGQTTIATAAQTAFVSGSGQGLSFRALERRAARSEFGSLDITAGAVQVIELDDQFWVVQVLAVQRAEKCPATLERVKAALFRDWLAEQRSAAKVEWFWGDAQRTKQDLAA